MARRVDKDANAESLGDQVRLARLTRRWTQEDLAHEAGLDRSFVGSLERGERNPSLDTMCRIAKALGVRLASLVGDLPR